MKNKKIFTFDLSTCFAALITLILIVSTFLMGLFVITIAKDVSGEYEQNIKSIKNSISMLVYKGIDDDISGNTFSISKYTKNLIERIHQLNLIEKIEVIKNQDNNMQLDQKVSNEKDEVIFKYGYDNTNANSRPESRNSTNENFTIIITPNGQYLGENNILIKFQDYIMRYKFVLISIIGLVSLITGIYMSSLVSDPLKKLSKAAKSLADGNFDIKIPQTSFVEVNSLIDSYNQMGSQLNELYTSLEKKVQERTTELKQANDKLKETQAMMVHSEKMRSLGELVAGIAHEINNPVNFIHGNIMILQNYADDLLKIINLYDTFSDKLTEDEKEKIKQLKDEVDLEFLKDDIKDLIRSCIEGTQRTKNIVLDLKNFSRMEEMVLTQFDIPKEIDTTLNILNNKYKNRITVIKNYEENVPKIEAYGGQLNQVFMNILDNAQDAIEGNGTVTINVKVKPDDSSKVQIEFIDTGVGIDKDDFKKVFEPFYTTKTVGKGTGLGMSISYRVINDHNGTIDIESEKGKGTKFIIVLPVEHKSKETEDKAEVK